MLLWTLNRVKRGEILHQGDVDLANDESLQAAHDVLLAQALRGPAFDVASVFGSYFIRFRTTVCRALLA